jgi:hypothetical protein
MPLEYAMRQIFIVFTLFLGLTGCLAGNIARNLSLRGKPLNLVEKRYGKPSSKVAIEGGNRYTWNAPDDLHPCTLSIIADQAERVTDVKMVGDNRDCYHYGNKRPQPQPAEGVGL